MADTIYNSFKEYMADGTIDLDSDIFKVILLNDTHAINAVDAVLADVVAEEISGTGYTAGGATLANVTWNRAAGTVTFDADDAAWPSATFTARYAIIYDDTPVVPADPLVCLIDFGANQQVSNNTFTLQFNASGILALS